MRMVDAMLAELEQEAAHTRRVLERIPDQHLEWRPHPKSYTLGQLALHVATLSASVAELAMQNPATPPQFVQPQPASSAELVPALERSLAKARSVLGGLDDSAMMATWRLVEGGRELMAMPRAQILRAIMLNHWYHHRGQLTVYLRELNIPVPAIYGPSADEPLFG
jgi:uncharacterized damage-inducible protein DinB